MERKTRLKISYAWGFALLVIGILINYFKLGSPNFTILGGLGNWLIYVGFVGLLIAIIKTSNKKEKKVDERVEFIANKASKVTFVFLILGAFVLMIIDGIKTITVPYYLFMSYLISSMVLVYFIAYKIIERRN